MDLTFEIRPSTPDDLRAFIRRLLKEKAEMAEEIEWQNDGWNAAEQKAAELKEENAELKDEIAALDDEVERLTPKLPRYEDSLDPPSYSE